MLCSSVKVSNQCTDFAAKFDQIPVSLVSCPCGRRSVPLNLLQSAIDCAEATLRCLTHLTASHQLASEALHQLTGDQSRCDWRGMACWIVDLLNVTTGESKTDGQWEHIVRLSPEQRNSLDFGHVLQLAKEWLSLSRNCLAGAAWNNQEKESDLAAAVSYLGTNLTTYQFENSVSGMPTWDD